MDIGGIYSTFKDHGLELYIFMDIGGIYSTLKTIDWNCTFSWILEVERIGGSLQTYILPNLSPAESLKKVE